MALLNLEIDYSRYYSHENYDRDLWSQMYEYHDRYLRDTTLCELEERYKSILRNKITLVSPNYDLFPYHNVFLSSWFWLRKEFETETEFNLRHEKVPVVDFSEYKKFIKIKAPIIKTQNNFEHVVRFGELSWFDGMLKHGKIHVKHASRYLDNDMNHAQKDDELNSYSYSCGDEVKIINSQQQVITLIRKVIYTTKLNMDCYILCTSQELDPVLFCDFPPQYDGCLLIKDIDEFAKRLKLAWAKKIGDWSFNYLPIIYYDEFNINPILGKNDISLENVPRDPITSKSFHFAYQKEYRFWWLGSNQSHNEKSLGDNIELELGSLEDIAEIYSLSELMKTS